MTERDLFLFLAMIISFVAGSLLTNSTNLEMFEQIDQAGLTICKPVLKTGQGS